MLRVALYRFSIFLLDNRDTAVSDNDGSFARRRLPREPSGITMMAERVSKKQEEEKVQDEWQLAARVINRLFLVGYLVAVVLSISGIFLQVPGVLVTRPSPPTSDDEWSVVISIRNKYSVDTRWNIKHTRLVDSFNFNLTSNRIFLMVGGSFWTLFGSFKSTLKDHCKNLIG